ncbi:MAG: ComEC family competence protein [Candidatus Yanofskybacteria bacterium]|nr:ComEC family competence protein [Candidatus Yanofskybacteria bacterium]
MHRSQIFFYILLSFVLGIFAGSFFNISKITALVAAVICAALIAIFYRRDSGLLNVKLAFAAFVTLFFFAGVLRYNAVNSKTHNLQKFAEAQERVVDPQNKHPIKVTILGYISNEPEVIGNKQRFSFYAKQLNVPPYMVVVEERVLITTELYPRYQYGDQLWVYGNIKKPENFDDFDYISYLAKDRIYTTLFYPEIKIADNLGVQLLSKYEYAKILIFKKIFVLKKTFEDSITRSIAEPNAVFINGILLGSRSQIPQDVKDDFSRTGTSHILAVSGYNITIVVMVISSFFILFLRRQTAFWFSLIGVAMFTVLTGAQASVVRASIMGSLVLLAQREGRLSDPRNAITLAGAVMILINPAILRYDIGFQLSFAATLGLIYVFPVLEKYFTKLPRLFNLRETFAMTVSAQLLVLPLLIYYFKNFSLTSLPANIIILPTIPFAMLLGFISGLIGIIMPFLGQFFGYFAWLLTTIELKIIKLLAAPSWATLAISFSWPMLLVSYCILVWFLRSLTKKQKVLSK